MPNPCDILQVRDLRVARHEQPLFLALSFNLSKASILQVVAANGVGKSSLFRVLAGLLPASSGEILWQDKLLTTDWEAYQQQIFYLDHVLAIKMRLTAMENLLLDHRLSCLSEQKAYAALRQLGLSKEADTLCGRLSRGQQQRVVMAKMLCSAAQLFILDEPLTALDVDSIAAVTACWLRLTRQGRSIIFSSHQAVNIPGIEVQRLSLKRCEDVMA